MTNIVLRSSLALACTMLLSAGARAETHIYATFGNFALQAFDLVPADGIDATALASGGRTELTQKTSFNGLTTTTSSIAWEDADTAASAQIGSLYGNAETSGAPLVSRSSTYVYSINDYGHSLSAGQELSFEAVSTVDITVSANTMILMSGHFSYSKDISSGNEGYLPRGWASASLSESITGEAEWSLSAPYSLGRDFTLGYVNNGNEAISLKLSLASGVLLYDRGTAAAQAVSAVPEPSGYLMLGGGLALLGALARRRNASRSIPSTCA
ncbi:MAG TPA: PEP-CTERM sorting domain-containing protein [Pseudoduganella sp.]|jgi:hypothetical protein